LSAALAGAVFSLRRHARLKQALRQSEDRFNDFAEFSADWFWECDARWRMTRIEGLQSLFGQDPRTAIGKTPFELAGVTEPDEHWQQHIAGLKRREPFRDFEFRHEGTNADGSQRWISVSGKPIFDAKGVFQGYRGTGRDISAEREIRERFAYIIENLSEGVSLWDRNDRFVVCNSAYRELAGKAAENLAPGATFREVVTKFAYSGESHIPEGEEEAWIEQRMRLHHNMEASIEVNRGDRWYAVHEQSLPDGSTVVRLTDVTERKRAEERLQQAQRLETIGKLTGGVAHDFNNLLAVVLGNLEFVVEDLPADHPHRKLLESAVAATERGATLTQRLLAFSRKQTLQPKNIDANSLIGGMVDLLRRTLGEQAQIEIISDGGLWHCDADPSQLENALLNLAINSRDAMPDGGRLIIETKNSYLNDSDTELTPDVLTGPYVMIAVTDTGQGIAHDVLEHIYEPFFTTKDVGKGSGLGLSMIYGFVKQSHGHITVESEPGRGTTFKIYLPRSQASEQAQASGDAVTPPAGAITGEKAAPGENRTYRT